MPNLAMTPYNSNGKINVSTTLQPAYGIIPYVVMQRVQLSIFAREMKYLHDNGFRMLLLNQLAYDPNNNVFYIPS